MRRHTRKNRVQATKSNKMDRSHLQLKSIRTWVSERWSTNVVALLPIHFIYFHCSQHFHISNNFDGLPLKHSLHSHFRTHSIPVIYSVKMIWMWTISIWIWFTTKWTIKTLTNVNPIRWPNERVSLKWKSGSMKEWVFKMSYTLEKEEVHLQHGLINLRKKTALFSSKL